MKKFLIINPFGIGDVLFTTPLVRAIKSAFPDSVIGYWCNQRVNEVLKHNENINIIFPLSRGDLKRIYLESKLKSVGRFFDLLRKIRKERFDVAIDFSLDHRYSLILKILRIKKRIGFNYKKRGRFLTDRIDIDGYSSKHIVEYYLELLKFLDITSKNNSMELPLGKTGNLKGKSTLERFKNKNADLIIAIAPGAGASWGKDASFKHWSPVKFARLADRIIDSLNAKVVILGSDKERNIAETMRYAMKHDAIDLVGKTNLEELIGIVNNVPLLVANDGGLLHIAVSLGKKTVSIFGPVDERVYGPYPISDKHIVIKKDIPCRPCYKKFKRGICDKDKECLNSISVEEVFEAVRRLV